MIGIDRKRQKIGDAGKTQPDFLKEFAISTKWAGGMVRGMADKAGVRTKDRIASFGSIDCTEESLAQAFNKWKEHGAGHYAGKKMSEWAQGGLNAVIRGVRLERERDPHHQFILENPAWSALRFDKQMKKFFGEGVVVQGCAYGGRKTGNAYRFWMSPDTLEAFNELEILPDDKVRSGCNECKAGKKHLQAACPQKGDKRPREGVPGELQKATKNRIPTLLASVIGRAMITGRERSEVRELEASPKRKR